jgi:hypothetical protein
VLAKSVETGLPRSINSGTAACANSDELFIVIAADSKRMYENGDN